MSKCWSDDVSFVFHSCASFGNTGFRGQIWGDFLAILEKHAGMADSEGCERNPFARDAFRPKVACLQNLSEIKKMACPLGSVLSDMHS